MNLLEVLGLIFVFLVFCVMISPIVCKTKVSLMDRLELAFHVLYRYDGSVLTIRQLNWMYENLTETAKLKLSKPAIEDE